MHGQNFRLWDKMLLDLPIIIWTSSHRKDRQCPIHLILLPFEDVPVVGIMYLVFTRMPGESYRSGFRSLLLCPLLYVSVESVLFSLLVDSTYRRITKYTARGIPVYYIAVLSPLTHTHERLSFY